MTLGEKLKAVREAQGLSLEKLGVEVNYTHGTLSRIENNKDEHVLEKLPVLRVALGITTVPLLDDERESFRTRLYIMYNLINDDEDEEAKKMQDKLSVIKLLTYEYEFNALYSLFCARLLLVDRKIEEAKVLFAKVELGLNSASNEVLYHYYYMQGTLNVKLKNYKNAFNFYMNAHGVWREKYGNCIVLYYALAFCARMIGRVSHAISFLENAQRLHQSEQAGVPGWHIDNALASDYIHFGLIDKARKLQQRCLKDAKNSKNKYRIGLAYTNTAYLYDRSRDWQTALGYAEDALECFEKGTVDYLSALLGKGRALLGMGNVIACRELLIEAKKLAISNEDYLMRFEALSHLITISDKESLDYLETVTIPYFLGANQNMIALEFCEQVKEHYEKKKMEETKKALKIDAIMTRIYAEMHGRGEIK